MRVFIQNEAGSDTKNYHDEKALAWQRSMRVSRAYPYPYGFMIGTSAADGCNVDCFVLTSRALKTGEVVECEPVGLMEQVEDGVADHNVLAVLDGEPAEVDETAQHRLVEFVQHVFDHVPGKQVAAGRFLGRSDAEAHLTAHRDDAGRSVRRR